MTTNPEGVTGAPVAEIEDGGTAFPGLNAVFAGIDSDGGERYETQPTGGMTLRDYFAVHLLSGLLSRVETERGDYVTNATAEQAAQSAYLYADAMLKARRT